MLLKPEPGPFPSFPQVPEPKFSSWPISISGSGMLTSEIGMEVVVGTLVEMTRAEVWLGGLGLRTMVLVIFLRWI